MSGFSGSVQHIGCIENPLSLIQHIAYAGIQWFIILVHEVTTYRESQTEIVSQLFVTHQYDFCVRFEEVLFLAVHFVIGDIFDTALTVDTVTCVRFFDSGTIIIECIFGRQVQPVSKVDFHSIISECSPTFVRVVALVQDVIRVTDTGSRTCPVYVCIAICRILFQVVQANIVRNTHQLSDCSVSTEVRTIFCFGTWKWNLSVHREIFVHFHSGIQVEVDSVELLVREYALIVRAAERSTKVRFICYVAHRYIVVLRETGIEVIFQFVAVFRECIGIAVPGFLHASVQYRSPTGRVCRIIFGIILRQRILVFILSHNVALSVTILHFKSFGYLAPSEVAAIAYSESIFLATFFGCDQDHTVTGTRTVESGGIRTFQYRDRFNIFRVDIDGRTTTVDTTVIGSIRVIIVTERYTVYNPERLVVICERRVTADCNLGRTTQASSGCIHLQTGYFTLQCTGHWRIPCLVQLVAFDFLYGIS